MRTAAFEFPGYLQPLVQLDAPLESIAHVGLHEYGHIAAGSLHHLVHRHLHEPHAVLQRAAVHVLAAVGIGRKKLAEQVSVPCMHLHGIETGLAGEVHGMSERLRHLLYLTGTHAAHESGRVDIQSAGGRYGQLPRHALLRHVAAVAYLNGGGRPFPVYRIGNPAQAGHYLLPHPQLSLEGETVARYRRVGERRHADAAPGHGDMVIFEHLRRRIVLAHALERSGTDGAVTERQRPYLGRSKKKRIFHVVRI